MLERMLERMLLFASRPSCIVSLPAATAFTLSALHLLRFAGGIRLG
jgi:hypothetical protein